MATCHVPACTGKCPSKMFMCKDHWFMVPEVMRKLIWKMYKAGKEFEARLTDPADKDMDIFRTAIGHVQAKDKLKAKQAEEEARAALKKKPRQRVIRREEIEDQLERMLDG